MNCHFEIEVALLRGKDLSSFYQLVFMIIENHDKSKWTVLILHVRKGKMTKFERRIRFTRREFKL